MNPNPHKRANICFDCENACGNCSWSAVDMDGKLRFEPVPGWTARKVTINLGKGRTAETYHITDCPQFRYAGKGQKSKAAMTLEQMEYMIGRLIKEGVING